LQDLKTLSFEVQPKQIVFVKELAEKIVGGSMKVTYRKTRKAGYYYVTANRFKKGPSNIVIEFFHSEKVDPYQLTDEEACLAGVPDAQSIRKMFEKWYGSPIPSLYRNWFRVVKSGEQPGCELEG
jgi:hypothetical protein